ncbi:MAG: CsgG/HfaB family protein [Phenylobacterium sp.]|uniref:CsgG/HfaB family protein n=1 Tax=Phenylobacterium sp. TaxID=1871053 RepID=UPI002722F4C9|nr:CsgG/HfaB family protein [Phenylobacterium sp.]MDO8911427.1 CsgG/HfaB family protein [Phenylobacterium sp.]MDP3098887.1 CsgG/HfaB family protein [Phenylobacterium sp.]
MSLRNKPLWAASCAALALAGCASGPEGMARPRLYSQPQAAKVSSSSQDLLNLPHPAAPVAVAVYGFVDQTGQFSPTDNIQTLSRALTQGATSVLVQSLREAGGGTWFTVLEREHLDNLLKERQVITEMRQRYLGESAVNPDALPSLLFAGVLLEGGVIGYDTNTLTGGAGARLLGVGANADYRQDTITVYLRAVATKTGEVLASVVVRKTVVSAGISGGAFRYVSYKNLLEAETGFTVNEPRTIALEQAVQKAAYDLVLEGARLNVWSFGDKLAGSALIDQHLASLSGARAQPAPKPIPVSRPVPTEAAQTPSPPPQTPRPAMREPMATAELIPASYVRPAPSAAMAATLPGTTTPKRATLAARPAKAPGRVAVQIGAYASAALAHSGWSDTAARFPTFVAGKARRVEPVARDGQTFYRASVEGFSDTSAAQAFCDALKGRGRDCLVKVRSAASLNVAARSIQRLGE